MVRSSSAAARGFTIFEISIVLVIIGLITGGILLGRDLIVAAQVRAQASQLEKYNAATNTFRNKYGCLPGDCRNIVEQGVGTAGDLGNGNGNRLFDRSTGPGVPLRGKEVLNFWYHLKQAGLIAGPASGWMGDSASIYTPGLHTPPLKLEGDNYLHPTEPTTDTFYAPGGMWIITVTDVWNEVMDENMIEEHLWFLTNDAQDRDHRCGMYFASRAYALDSKIDDGKPKSGIMRARPYLLTPAAQIGAWGVYWPDAVAINLLCTEKDANAYNFSQNLSPYFEGISLGQNSSGCCILIQTGF